MACVNTRMLGLFAFLLGTWGGPNLRQNTKTKSYQLVKVSLVCCRCWKIKPAWIHSRHHSSCLVQWHRESWHWPTPCTSPLCTLLCLGPGLSKNKWNIAWALHICVGLEQIFKKHYSDNFVMCPVWWFAFFPVIKVDSAGVRWPNPNWFLPTSETTKPTNALPRSRVFGSIIWM